MGLEFVFKFQVTKNIIDEIELTLFRIRKLILCFTIFKLKRLKYMVCLCNRFLCMLNNFR